MIAGQREVRQEMLWVKALDGGTGRVDEEDIRSAGEM